MAGSHSQIGQPREPKEKACGSEPRGACRAAACAKSEYAKRNYFDVWLPELAPSPKLLSYATADVLDGKRWTAFAKRYESEMHKPGPAAAARGAGAGCRSRRISRSAATASARTAAIAPCSRSCWRSAGRRSPELDWRYTAIKGGGTSHAGENRNPFVAACSCFGSIPVKSATSMRLLLSLCFAILRPARASRSRPIPRSRSGSWCR